MPTPPDPAVLYPDVAACGSLSAALRAASGGRLDGVPVVSSDSDPLRHASVTSTVRHREPLQITGWLHQRAWSVSGTDAFQGLPLLNGRTEDLAQVARAARAWYDGADLTTIAGTAPFVRLSGRAEIAEADPTRMTEGEWQGMRREAADLEYDWQPAYQALIEAAYAEPALRALYPFTSHWVLRFSTSTRPLLTVVGPCLRAGDTFTVGTGIVTPDLGSFARPGEAVAAAVRHLPAGVGPVTLGGPLSNIADSGI